MNPRHGVLVVAIVLGGMVAVGCNDKKIAALTAERDELSAQNGSLREQLNESAAREADLLAKLTGVEGELTELKSRPAPAPVAAPAPKPTPAANGWEAGLAGDRISVGADILFASGRATLTTAGKAALDKIASDIKSSYAGMPVRVYGHTDSDPIRKTRSLWQDNLDLSANRAMAVTRYLIDKGVKAEVVETIAMGQVKPAASNTSASGKAKNRRVEIVVVKNAG